MKNTPTATMLREIAKERAAKKMDPNRFTIGERVSYENHVTGDDLGMLEVVSIDADFVTAAKFFAREKTFRFTHEGRAVWSPNLSICHEGEPNPHAEESRTRNYGW